MKVVAFNGSPRANGNTARLVRAAFAALEKEGIATELVQLSPVKPQGCMACHKCFERQDGLCAVDDELNRHLGLMREADGIILASPTYFADVTPQMKALMDRAGLVAKANGCLLRRKAGAAVVAVRRGGAIHAFDTMNHFFTIGEMITVGSDYWNMGIGLGPGDVEQDREGLETMRRLGENMAWLLKRISCRCGG